MNTKLTLTLEDEVIAHAKEYAQQQGQSLSKLVEAYFKLLTRNKATSIDQTLHPDVKALYGCVQVPTDFDWKKELADVIEQRYDEGIR
jgi:hypothetical protein